MGAEGQRSIGKSLDFPFSIFHFLFAISYLPIPESIELKK